MPPILIERVTSITDDVRALIYELDSGLAVAYPPEQMHGLTLNSLMALLAHIEDVTMNAGIPLLRLETGVRQPAAIRLYERVGFHPCAAFGPYTSMAPSAIKNSLFYEKKLS